MQNQLNLFKESHKRRYKAFYDDFYKGVRERYHEQLKAEQNDKHERISILIKPIKTKEHE